MERTNAQKKPKKRKKSSSKPQQKQSQKQSVVVNISQAKQQQRRKKSSASKAKATAMPSSQQQQQLVQQQPLQQPPFIYANPPPVVNPLNPRVAVPAQERPLNPLQLEPPAVVKPTATSSLAEQMKMNAQRQEAMIAKQLEFNLQQMPMASVVPPAVVAEPMKSSPLAPPKQDPSPIASLADRRMADLQMPQMTMAEPMTQLSPVEEEMLRRRRGRPAGSKDVKPRKRSTSTEMAQKRADALQPFKFGGSQFEEAPPLDRYYGFSRTEGAEPKLLVQRAEPQQTLAMSVQETEPAPLGLTSDEQMSFM